jgi:hypothetical protein
LSLFPKFSRIRSPNSTGAPRNCNPKVFRIPLHLLCQLPFAFTVT